MNLSSGGDLALWERMELIRRAEEKVRAHYPEDGMKTPCHLSVGQEALAVGVCAAMRPGDQLLGTYRSHAIYLAQTGEVRNFFLELYGKGTAWAKGKAGSMHLAAPRHGLLVTSAVVGTTIPVAMGVALANQRLRNGRVAVVFFGDGAIDEGVFWETLNYASLARLPLVLVCEDNDLAIHCRAADRHGYDSLAAIAERFRCHVAASDTTDPAEVRRLTAEAIAQHFETGRPALLHLRCCRYLEHVGVGDDWGAGYRAREELERWQARDGLALVRARLLSAGHAEAELEGITRRIEDELTAAVAAAKAAPFPAPAELFTDVFA